MTPDQQQSLVAAGTTFFLVTTIISVALIIFAIVIYWRIFAKAGYSGALGLLMFIPIANIIVICVLAFGEWPIYRELNALRQRVNMIDAQQRGGQSYPYPYGQPR